MWWWFKSSWQQPCDGTRTFISSVKVGVMKHSSTDSFCTCTASGRLCKSIRVQHAAKSLTEPGFCRIIRTEFVGDRAASPSAWLCPVLLLQVLDFHDCRFHQILSLQGFFLRSKQTLECLGGLVSTVVDLMLEQGLNLQSFYFLEMSICPMWDINKNKQRTVKFHLLKKTIQQKKEPSVDTCGQRVHNVKNRKEISSNQRASEPCCRAADGSKNDHKFKTGSGIRRLLWGENIQWRHLQDLTVQPEAPPTSPGRRNKGELRGSDAIFCQQLGGIMQTNHTLNIKYTESSESVFNVYVSYDCLYWFVLDPSKDWSSFKDPAFIIIH